MDPYQHIPGSKKYGCTFKVLMDIAKFSSKEEDFNSYL